MTFLEKWVKAMIKLLKTVVVIGIVFLSIMLIIYLYYFQKQIILPSILSFIFLSLFIAFID